MEDFVAYESRPILGLVLVMAGAIFLAGLWLSGIFGTVPHSPSHSDRETVVVGWCFLLFSGFFGFLTLKSFLNPSEQLRIGPQGVRFADWSDDTIPWSGITKVTTRELEGRFVQKVIVLNLQNPDRFPGRGLARVVAAENRNRGGGDIFLNLSGTNRSFADALSAIQRFKPVG